MDKPVPTIPVPTTPVSTSPDSPNPVPASQALVNSKQSNLPVKSDKPALPVKGARAPSKSKNKLLLGVVFGVFAVVIIIFAILAIVKNSQGQVRPSNDPRLRPTPTLIPRPTLEQTLPGQPSAYAQDPQILQLEAAIKTLSAQMEADTFSEPEIEPPLLETKITFK